MSKRILALFLALIMVFALVGCGKNKKRVPIKLTLSTADAEAILAAAGIILPTVEEAKGANSTVKYLSWVNWLQNYSEDEIVNTGYWTFTEKYKCEIEWVETTYEERNNDLAQYVLSSNSPDCTLTGTSNFAVFPYSCLRGMYQPVDDYVDYTDPLFKDMADAAEYFAMGGKHFAVLTDVTFKDVVPYNRRVMDEWGFDDPATLYYNDEWTWDVFYQMCMDFSDPDEDRYALDGWYYVNGLCEQSTGKTIIAKDENGLLYSNLDDPIIEVAENLIYDLVKNNCTYRQGTNYWAGRRDHEYGAGVKEGLCLFWICDKNDGFRRPVEEMNQIWGDIEEGEFMFCPLPRYQEGDGNYYLNAMPHGYMICQGAENPEGVALLAACERFKILDPTVVNIDKKQLKETYKWNDEMLDMLDICNNLVREHTVMFQTGDLGQKLNDAYNRIDWGINRSGGSSSWAQLKESNRDTLDYCIEETNAMIQDYIDSGDLIS